MSKITRLQLESLVKDAKIISALERIYHISNGLDPDIHKIAALNIYRYTKYIDDDLRGIEQRPETLNKIASNTLDLIHRLPDKAYENPLQKITKEILNQQSQALRFISLTRILLILSLLVILSGLLLFIIPKDPLNISGNWRYVVTPPYDEEKLWGKLAPQDQYKPIFDSVCGSVEIKSIVFGSTSYSMEGKRASMWYLNNDTVDNFLTKPLGLTFTELSHEKRGEQRHFFFRFEADGDDKSKGFVKLDFHKRMSSKKMIGKIYYLYSDHSWREVDIIFYKN
jgi:hypothetical protein